MQTTTLRCFLATLAAIGFVTPAVAQDVPQSVKEPIKMGADGLPCELHIWPNGNHDTHMSGLLSAIPIIGFALDQEGRKGKAKAVKYLMREYLSPEAQIELLKEQGVAKQLGLDGYQIVVEDAFPSDEARRKSKELKAKRKARFAKLKAKQRLTNSKSSCYAELATTFIMYQKTARFDSNFTIGWSYRDYGSSPTVITEFRANSGEIKNGSLEFFPPKTDADFESAETELRSQYSKGF